MMFCVPFSSTKAQSSFLGQRPKLVNKGQRLQRLRAQDGGELSLSEQQQQILAAALPFGPNKEPTVHRLLATGPSVATDTDSSRLTVYTLRLTTGNKRGGALTDPTAGVFVALVGEGGEVLLQRCCPVNDPVQAEQDLKDICQVVGDDSSIGANCPAALALAASSANRSKPMRRFEEGNVDEFVFLGREVGPLTGVLVGPESGRWYCEEVNVCSSRSGLLQRFVCRDFLGDKGARNAAWLQPVPAEAVVYGTGDSAVILSKEQAAALRSLGLAQYSDLKVRLLLTTASLVTMGTGLSWLLAGPELALPFAVGGCLGIVYQLMLQQGVDGLPLEPTELGKSQGRNPMSSSSVRLATLLALACAFYGGQQVALDSLGLVEEGVDTFTQVLATLSGFLMYKLAVIGVTVTPAEPKEPLFQQRS